MKRIAFVWCLLINTLPLFAQQQAYKIKLLSNYNDPNLPKVDITDIWNDLTGYYDPIKNREYIIAGGTDSVYFFDITIATEIKLIERRWGRSHYARNRDFETFKHYAYCVADQGSGLGGLQIFDLQYLPDSVHLVYQDNALGSYTHTIFIDSISERMYMCSNSKNTGSSAMDIISLANPEQPVLLAELDVPQKPGGGNLFGNVHEMYARNDTAYLSCGDYGLFIFDLRNIAQQGLIGSITSYPDQGYNHSSMLDASGRYLMFTDENTGLDVKIFDIHNLGDPLYISQFNSNALATPHNAFWVGDLAYVSAYHDGVRIYNVRDPANPVQVAWYDTHPDTPEVYGGYKGCWGVYPYLPSKHLIASDLTRGIFVFEVDSNLTGIQKAESIVEQFKLFPNPAHDWVNIECSLNTGVKLQLMDLTGNVILDQEIVNGQSRLDMRDLEAGTYLVKVSTASSVLIKKLIRW